MAKKTGLGRGIGSLFQEDVEVNTPQKEESVREIVKEVTVNEPLYVKIRDIEPNREQPRKAFDEDALNELAENIKQFGVISPLLLVKNGKRYEIVAGERRWRAAKLAGLKEVPAIVRDYTRQEISEIALIENIQREDLNPVEEAKAYKRLLDEFSLTQEEISTKVNKSRAYVANSLRILKLPEQVLNMVCDGKVSVGHAKVLLGLNDEESMISAAETVVEKALSVRDTEKLVKSILEGPKVKTETPLSHPEIYEKLEERLAGVLNSKVLIKRSNENRGKIEISYSSLEELEGIIGRIM